MASLNYFSATLSNIIHTFQKGLCRITARWLECVLMSSFISIICSYTYISVVGCYAAWNNNYSGQEEATLCIVKCLKEDRKLVFQMRNKVHMWLDFGKPTEMSHLANCTFLAQLIATLIHYPCTVVIPGLAAWSAFLERILPTMWGHDWDNGTHGGY